LYKYFVLTLATMDNKTHIIFQLKNIVLTLLISQDWEHIFLPPETSNRRRFLLIVVIMEVTIRFLIMRENHAEDI
jgi:hypothetical protein